MPDPPCPLCGNPAPRRQDDAPELRDVLIVDCPSCREFTIDGAAVRALARASATQRQEFSEHARQTAADGGRLNITSDPTLRAEAEPGNGEDAVRVGDAVIRHKSGHAISQFGIVMNDGVPPEQWHVGTVAEVKAWAEKAVTETGGQIFEFTDP